MARLPSEFKLGLLQWIFDSVENGDYPNILEHIKVLQHSGAATVKGGQTVVSASGGGYSTQFAIPGKFSPDEMFSFWAELRRIYTYALSDLATAGNTSPSQSQIYVQMVGDNTFSSITSTRGDYSMLRGGGA